MKRRTTDGMSLKSEWYNIRNASLDMLILRLIVPPSSYAENVL